MPLPTVDWQTIPISLVTSTLAATNLVAEEEAGIRIYPVDNRAQLPVPFAFRTAVGTLGLLQLTDYVEEPPGARLRFQLVNSGSPTNAAIMLSVPVMVRANAMARPLGEMNTTLYFF